jgi:hypothetical protein
MVVRWWMVCDLNRCEQNTGSAAARYKFRFLNVLKRIFFGTNSSADFSENLSLAAPAFNAMPWVGLKSPTQQSQLIFPGEQHQ